MGKIDDALLLAADLRPYYARAISALTPVPSDTVPTIGVDTSWRLYYSPEWVEETPLRQLAAVIAAHEVEHLLRNHARRRCERSHAAWNLAGDLEINDDCELELPPDGVFPSAFGLRDGLLAEEYFEQLERSVSQVCCGSGAGSPLPGELDPSGLALDVAAKDALISAVRADVVAQAAAAPGSVPAGIVMWATTEPTAIRLPWPRLLTAAVRGVVGGRGRTDYSWRRLSRRDSAVARPASVAVLPTVALIVDTSGSMGDYGPKVLGSVRDIITRSGSRLVACIECDARAAKKRRVGGWTGGGGTDLREGFAALNDVRRSATIVITDCESPWPDAPVPSTIVLSTSTHSGPHWARTIRI